MLKLPVYLYTPRVRVFYNLEGESTRAIDNMYQSYAKLARGAKQTIQFYVLNGDQRPRPIHGENFVFNLYDAKTNELRLTKPISVTDDGVTVSTRGLAQLTVVGADTDRLNSGLYNFAILIQDGNEQIPAYFDGATAMNGRMELVDGILPAFVPSIEITGFRKESYSDWFSPASTGYVYAGNNHGVDQNLRTIAIYLNNFVGDFRIQGTLENTVSQSSTWADIDVETFDVPTTGTQYRNITGVFTYFRFSYKPLRILPTPSGSIDKILYRS
jgi:hypothetical protein